MRNQIVGSLGEDKACEHLIYLGYEIIKRNYKVKAGEIDLIAKKESEILFVEVKTRTSNSFGFAVESLPKKRIERLFSASQFFISENKGFEDFEQRYILVAIDNDKIELVPIDGI